MVNYPVASYNAIVDHRCCRRYFGSVLFANVEVVSIPDLHAPIVSRDSQYERFPASLISISCANDDIQNQQLTIERTAGIIGRGTGKRANARHASLLPGFRSLSRPRAAVSANSRYPILVTYVAVYDRLIAPSFRYIRRSYGHFVYPVSVVHD